MRNLGRAGFALRTRRLAACISLLTLGTALSSAGPAAEADFTAGALLAERGAPAQGLAACTTCHGQKGQGNATAGIPRLAGQGERYLRHQLEAFVNGERPSAVMTPIAGQLREQQRADLARYFSRVAAPSLPPTGVADSVRMQRGQQLSLHGDAALGVPACSACHGWNGAGYPPDIPYLAGQHLEYLREELQDWRSTRSTDHRQQMPQIVRRLSDEDLEALAHYFTRMPPPHALAAVHSSGPGRVPAQGPPAAAQPHPEQNP